MKPAGDERSRSGSLSHGLAILDLFSAEEPVLAVSEMARRLGVHRSSASRLAATLSAAGYLRPAGAPGRYALGGKLTRLAGLAAQDAALPDAATPALRELVRALGESGHLAQLDGIEVVTTAVVDGWRSVRMHSTVGKRSPAHATAIGKVLLAGLPDAELRRRYGRRALERRTPATVATLDALLAQLEQVREHGCAFDREELEAGLHCIAAPVRDHSGAVVAAAGISGPADRITPQTRDELAGAVRATADEISARLGYGGGPNSPGGSHTTP
jgi:DNA-binding IclR family transcriptional regulator